MAARDFENDRRQGNGLNSSTERCRLSRDHNAATVTAACASFHGVTPFVCWFLETDVPTRRPIPEDERAAD